MAAPDEEYSYEQAPSYTVPTRRLGALEHPMIIKDLDKGIKTFGQNFALEAILDTASPQISVPLYLRYDNPTVRPLTSHNALTHNVVVRVTVPKRTGRKRKRGTNDPFEGEIEQPDPNSQNEVKSQGRMDIPRLLRRKLCDNVGKYTVEPIGVVTNTHRYRGMADFQYAMGGSKFMTKFVDKVLPGEVDKLKQFVLEPGIESGSNIDLIPPPYFTPMTLPFGYNYTQNPYTKEVSPGPESGGSVSGGDDYTRVVNVTSRVPAAGYFIAHDEYPVPVAPRRDPDMSDPQVATIMTEMYRAMEERPIWTRRSMWNRLGSKFASLPKSGSLVRHCLQYAGYQFKGGPWRDALVKYGLDPRTDPKYRIYQTLIFKLHKTRIGSVGRSWQAVRRNEIGVTNFGKYWQEIGDDDGPRDTHVFNGEAFSADGKVWQVCDITDPLLQKLFANAEVRTDCDVEIGGYYHRVLWSVAKAIMKCKMLAIRFGRTLTDDDFGATLDAVKGPMDGGDGGGTSIGITLPDLQLTAAECEQLRGKKMKPGLKPGRDRFQEKRKKTHYRVRIPLKDSEQREAEKMIRLLSANNPKALQSLASTPGDASKSLEGDKSETGEGENGQETVRPTIEGEDNEDQEDREGERFQQELLDDLDGDEDDDDESDVGGEDEEEEMDTSMEQDEEEDGLNINPNNRYQEEYVEDYGDGNDYGDENDYDMDEEGYYEQGTGGYTHNREGNGIDEHDEEDIIEEEEEEEEEEDDAEGEYDWERDNIDNDETGYNSQYDYDEEYDEEGGNYYQAGGGGVGGEWDGEEEYGESGEGEYYGEEDEYGGGGGGDGDGDGDGEEYGEPDQQTGEEV